MCQVVAYGRLKTIENFKQSSLKVVAYERWSPTRGSIYSALKTFCKTFVKRFVKLLEKWSLMRGDRLGEVVAKGGSTVRLNLLFLLYAFTYVDAFHLFEYCSVEGGVGSFFSASFSPLCPELSSIC